MLAANVFASGTCPCLSRHILDIPFAVVCILKHYKGKGSPSSPHLDEDLINICAKGTKLATGKLSRASSERKKLLTNVWVTGARDMVLHAVQNGW